MKAHDKHIVIVGAGPGGLTAAMILAHRGFRISVFEAKDTVGGRNAPIHMDGYTFDTGPTFLMLKTILDEVFHEAGAATDSLMDMRRIEPMYRLVFTDKSIEPVSDPDAMTALLKRLYPGREQGYRAFHKREAVRLAKLFPCLQKPYHTFSSLFSLDMLAAVPHLALGRSLFDVMKGYFGDEELALAFTFQSKYLGMAPWECPGLFSIIPFIEHSLGIYHPIGGLSRISECMAEVARRDGAEIHLSTRVKRILVKDGAARGIELENGEQIHGDDVVINADFGYAAQSLFEPGVLRKYTPERLGRMRVSCSTFMLYLGLDKKYDAPHHTICFADDYRAHIDAVSRGEELKTDISFYLRNADQTDPTIAPDGGSAVYVLVPVPNARGRVDWAAARDTYRDVVLDAVERRTEMTDIRQHIRAEHMITPDEWEHDYNVFDAATFNLAHNWGQLIYFRPRNKFEELDHCYLAGGGTHPGSGLPTIYESGRIAANLISRAHGIPFVSANLHV
ncbi:MAG: phytoene desaturase [Candidatus Hydrogenedentes bacterium]|nr:phytoene desaturase [Candidatus Hydrogenedentota bacterium]